MVKITLPFVATAGPHPQSKAIRATLNRLLPSGIFNGEDADAKAQLENLIPQLHYFEHRKTISLHLIAFHRKGGLALFQEQLIGRISFDAVVSLSSVDFRLPDLCDETVTCAEVVISMEGWQSLKGALPEFEQQLWASLRSVEQNATVYEHLFLLRQRTTLGPALFAQMKRTLTLLSTPFKERRSNRHLGRLISYQTLFRSRGLLSVKLFRTHVEGRGRVSGVLAHVKLREREMFAERHLLKAIHSLFPHVRLVQGSSFSDGEIQYVEVEGVVSFEKGLQERLEAAVRGCVERPTHALLVPRNEEEIMRHIVTLQREVRYVNELPQVILYYHEQASTELCFNAVVVRVLQPATPAIETLLAGRPIDLDEKRRVGRVRSRYPKEALALRLYVPKEPFFREDCSLDLYNARGRASLLLTEAIGPWRDYYGGLMARQHTLLQQFKEAIPLKKPHEQRMAEAFFHSIRSGLGHALLEVETLVRLFKLVVEARVKEEVLMEEDDDHLVAAVCLPKRDKPKLADAHLIQSQIPFGDRISLGVYYTGRNLKRRQSLVRSLTEPMLASRLKLRYTRPQDD